MIFVVLFNFLWGFKKDWKVDNVLDFLILVKKAFNEDKDILRKVNKALKFL